MVVLVDPANNRAQHLVTHRARRTPRRVALFGFPPEVGRRAIGSARQIGSTRTPSDDRQ